jgi:aminoglycoside phosphotransferase family enzyme
LTGPQAGARRLTAVISIARRVRFNDCVYAPPTATTAADPTPPASDLAAKVRYLSTPAAYPHGPEAVEAIETHMAWVFLAGDQAFKLKKPVRYEYLDFSTLERREHDCREEVRLNRRLAADVYLGLFALVRTAGPALALRAERELRPGEAVADWLVHMRRLPADRMLDRAIRQAAVTVQDIDRVGAVLGAFYQRAPAADIGAGELVARFRREQQRNRVLLSRADMAPDPEPAFAALDAVDRALETMEGALADRVAQRAIVEGHGDLRPEHVCLLDPPRVIDCLEFDRQLRLVDPYEELAFLGLECEFAGADWIGPRLLARCAGALGGVPVPLLRFYTAQRALLRARIALAHLLEPQVRDPATWRPQARRYIDRALAALSSGAA